MNYCPERDNHSRAKVKAVLDLSNHDTKKRLEHTTHVDTSNIAIKKRFCCFVS